MRNLENQAACCSHLIDQTTGDDLLRRLSLGIWEERRKVTHRNVYRTLYPFDLPSLVCIYAGVSVL